MVSYVMDVANAGVGSDSLMHRYYEFVEINGKTLLRNKKTGQIVGSENEEKDK